MADRVVPRKCPGDSSPSRPAKLGKQSPDLVAAFPLGMQSPDLVAAFPLVNKQRPESGRIHNPCGQHCKKMKQVAVHNFINLYFTYLCLEKGKHIFLTRRFFASDIFPGSL